MDISFGQIILWKGKLSSIPSGWHICDGNFGTPDLRDKFIFGKYDDSDTPLTGGSTWHSHSVVTSASGGGLHTHNMSGVTKQGTIAYRNIGGTYPVADAYHEHDIRGTLSSSNDAHTHTTGLNSSYTPPPYIRLYYIMRII